MKFNCGPTKDEKRVIRYNKFQQKQHRRYLGERWFAWYPVRVGSGDCRWLEFVIRKDDNLYTTYYDNNTIKSSSYHWTPKWKYESIE